MREVSLVFRWHALHRAILGYALLHPFGTNALHITCLSVHVVLAVLRLAARDFIPRAEKEYPPAKCSFVQILFAVPALSLSCNLRFCS